MNTTTTGSVAPVTVGYVDFYTVDGVTEAAWWNWLALVVAEMDGFLLHHIASQSVIPEPVRLAMFTRLAAHIRLMEKPMHDNNARILAALLLAEEAAEDAP